MRLLCRPTGTRCTWGHGRRDPHTKMNSFSASSPESLDLLPGRLSLLGGHGFCSRGSGGCWPQLLLETETEPGGKAVSSLAHQETALGDQDPGPGRGPGDLHELSQRQCSNYTPLKTFRDSRQKRKTNQQRQRHIKQENTQNHSPCGGESLRAVVGTRG